MNEAEGPIAETTDRLAHVADLDLNTITPDVVGGLALSMGLVVTGATEGIRHTAQRTVDHFQELNARYPSHVREGFYLDRIETAALTGASILTQSYVEMTGAIDRANELYHESTVGGIGSGIRFALLRGLLKVCFIMGLGWFVTTFLLHFTEAADQGGDRLKWLPLAIAFALPVVTNAMRDLFLRMKMANLAYRRDVAIAEARKKRARAQIRAIECTLVLARLAWDDFAPAGEKLPQATPVLNLFRALNEEELTTQVPMPFFAMVRKKVGAKFRKKKEPEPERNADEFEEMMRGALKR